jgi:hypothetical protein
MRNIRRNMKGSKFFYDGVMGLGTLPFGTFIKTVISKSLEMTVFNSVHRYSKAVDNLQYFPYNLNYQDNSNL